MAHHTYWYFTEGDADFLGQVYEKEVSNVVLKKRIVQITEEAMNAVFAEIDGGQLKKAGQEEDEGRLEIGVGVKEFYETVPVEDKRNDMAKDRVKHISEDLKSFKEKMEQIKQRNQMKKAEKAAM